VGSLWLLPEEAPLFSNHGYEPQSKLWGIKPSASRDNSTYKLQCTLFLNLGSHYNLPIPLRFAFEIGVSTIISEKNGNIRENVINITIISPTLRGIL
jgi:hypothetical protein